MTVQKPKYLITIKKIFNLQVYAFLLFFPFTQALNAQSVTTGGKVSASGENIDGEPKEKALENKLNTMLQGELFNYMRHNTELSLLNFVCEKNQYSLLIRAYCECISTVSSALPKILTQKLIV